VALTKCANEFRVAIPDERAAWNPYLEKREGCEGRVFEKELQRVQRSFQRKRGDYGPKMEMLLK